MTWSSLLRLDPDEKLKLDEQNSKFLNSTLTPPKTVKETPLKPYVDSLYQINRNSRDLSSVENDQVNEVGNIKSTKVGSITINRDLSSDNELANKKVMMIR